MRYFPLDGDRDEQQQDPIKFLQLQMNKNSFCLKAERSECHGN